MSHHTIHTQFGQAQVRVHRTEDGWMAMLVGRHLVPCPPCLPSPRASSEADAVAQLEAAIGAVAAQYSPLD